LNTAYIGNKQTDKQTNKQTNRQTNRQAINDLGEEHVNVDPQIYAHNRDTELYLPTASSVITPTSSTNVSMMSVGIGRGCVFQYMIITTHTSNSLSDFKTHN